MSKCQCSGAIHNGKCRRDEDMIVKRGMVRMRLCDECDQPGDSVVTRFTTEGDMPIEGRPSRFENWERHTNKGEEK